MRDTFIAHFRKKDQKDQSLLAHLTAVSHLTREFAEKVGLGEVGELIGMLHDFGKFSEDFQNYICSANGLIDPDSDSYIDAEAKKGEIDHSSAGAQVAYNHLHSKGPAGLIAAEILSLCIASHHSGLIDCLSPDGENKFLKRINKSDAYTHTSEILSCLTRKELEIIERLLGSETLVSSLINKLQSLKEVNDSQDTLLFKFGLLIRFLFSCLIDADRLDTADFEMPENAFIRNYGKYHPWSILIERLNNKIKEFENKTNKNDVDILRNQVSQYCCTFATRPKGIYQLSVPTGGGKTLSSLRFALHHAEHHQMDRIFYVIPYTSIIDQNADETRKILEDKDENGNYLDNVVLEHHSNLTPEEESRRQHLLSENWDAPIVFTTQVQFLETLFGSGTRSVRRMHQLANAVIIFDEVQTIPIRCVHMFNTAIRFLVNNCGATVVLCTATQPLLNKIDPPCYSLKICPDQQIIPNEKEMFAKLKRVMVKDYQKIGGWSDNEVAELAIQELDQKGSVLLIVNTRTSACSLYQALKGRVIAKVYHLSTNMCPAHRLEVLAKVKEKIDKEPVICVSTQLIEAGVDIDFGSVIRFLAGLDSIAQAAGRCNRNGRRDTGNVLIVNPVKEKIERLEDIVIGSEMTKRVLAEFNEQPETFDHDRIGLEAMNRYYQYYFYRRKNVMGYPVGSNSPVGRDDTLFNLLSINSLSVEAHRRISKTEPGIPFRQSFQTAAKVFHVIDSPTRGVIVPYSAVGEEIINELCGSIEIDKQFKLLKRAQRYSVNMLPDQLIKMAEKYAIREVQKGSGVYYLDDQYYSEEFGWSDEPVNAMDTLIY